MYALVLPPRTGKFLQIFHRNASVFVQAEESFARFRAKRERLFVVLPKSALPVGFERLPIQYMRARVFRMISLFFCIFSLSFSLVLSLQLYS